MKITVTQQDIEKGIPAHCNFCPIALAVDRQTGKYCEVLMNYITIGNSNYNLPKVASEFIFDFDENTPVKPFSFELDIPEIENKPIGAQN